MDKDMKAYLAVTAAVLGLVALAMLVGCGPMPAKPLPQTITPMCDQPRGALVYVVKDGERVTALSAMPSACKAEGPKQ
jgi:hypothetical protein